MAECLKITEFDKAGTKGLKKNIFFEKKTSMTENIRLKS